jgi:hypothetical protein
MNPIATRMNYMRDTLLGPISKSAECNVVITPITPGAFQVQVLSPVPDDLHKAHSLTFLFHQMITLPVRSLTRAI